MRRFAILAYGVISYLIFFASFLYLIGFVAGVVVPKDINGGIADSSISAILINLSFILLFGVQHTIMARSAFKERWTKIIPAAAERSTFVLVTSLILMATFWQWRAMPEVIWSAQSPILVGLLYAGCALGFGIVLISTFLIDHFDLFGLRQVYLQFVGKEYTHPPLKVVSLYRFVRHPIMVGMILAFWSVPHMTVGHLLFAIGFTAYIVIGTQVEEKALIAELGDEYTNYMAVTPGLIPSLKPSPAIKHSEPAVV
jgi:protein-S-isoprenylcysteine O-methyltransferase Ste14